MATEVLKIQADTSDLEKSLKRVDNQLDEIGREATETGAKIDKGLSKGEKRTEQISKNTKGLNKAFTALGGVVAATFAVSKIISFTKEAVKLAGELQGVKRAFDQLNSPGLLDNLRSATRGTVSNLELMKQAVRANNFKVPLERLGTFFEFATKRATQTGDSVDDLTNSIIDGIGRKSTLVLDNLGISATELQEEIKKVGDFGLAAGNIIDRELGKMGDVSDTAAINTARLSTSVQNLSATIGTLLAPTISTMSSGLADVADDLNTVLGAESLSAWEKLGFAIASATTFGTEYDMLVASVIPKIEKENEVLELQAKIIAGIGASLVETVEVQLPIIKNLKDQIKAYDEQLASASSINDILRLTEERTRTQIQLKEIEAKIDKRRLDTEIKIAAAKRKDIDDGSTPLDVPIIQDEFVDFELGIDLAGDSFIEEQERITSAAEEIWDDYYQNILEEQADNLDQQTKNAEAQAEYEIQLQQQKSQAIDSLISATFALSRSLSKEDAEAQKALAVFEATLNAGLAISRAFKDYQYPVSLLISAAVGVQAAAQVASIANTSVPSFYEGTEFLNRGKKPKGKDTIPVMAHEGEAIIPSNQNAKYPGLAKAWISDDLDKYISVNHVIPALKRQRHAENIEKTMLLSQTLRGSVNADLNDARIVDRLRNQEYILEEIAYSVRPHRKINPYRA